MRLTFCSLLGACFLYTYVLPWSSRAADYETEIRLILEENCLDCHGPDKQKSKLRVDKRALLVRGGDSGMPSIVPGDPTKSHLIDLVKGTDPDEIMPPKGEPLTSDQIALLVKWIEGGAEWPGQMDEVAEVTTDHWSFQPVIRPAVPSGANKPVDAFLIAELKDVGIEANGPADARSLIRRVSIVLTGLPPTPERVATFEETCAQDSDAAYAELVDELLVSKHFGERWAQHWLDVIRWAETNGSESNLYRKNAWIYRDYVIRAFNEDLPYDRFVREQLAGDQLGCGDATGFLVAGPHVPAATVGQEETAIRQARADRMDEIMQTVGASMLGVTVGCARCHNHKFDPISIKDYYALTAVFQGVEFGGRVPEFSADHPRRERAQVIGAKMFTERATLRKFLGVWEENWGGFAEVQFPATTTNAVRIEFQNKAAFVDELELFGPDDYYRNVALASNGASLVTNPSMTQLRGDLKNANDGIYGTMTWKSRAPEGSKVKPWVEVHFKEPHEVSRFRFSSNREYYFETDYLEKMPSGTFPAVRISTMQSDGSWKEVGNSQQARKNLNQKPAMKGASARLHDQIAKLKEEGPRHSFVGQFKRPGVTHILHRGSPENPRDEVAPAGFDILKGDLGLESNAPDAKRRLQFAEWLTDPGHPLTARVIVNRLWHHVFGAGIVPTSSDFGLAGAMPTHPELLDWLAAEFVEPSGAEGTPWSMKGMVRRLVMTDAFRRASQPSEVALRADAGSALLWRYPPRRMEAEVIRDGILQASDKLDRRIGGPSYRIHNVKKTYAQWEVVNNHGPNTWRRMLYQERYRRVDDKMFTAFDFPDCGQVRAKRPVSTTPLQALNLMNSDFVIEQAKFIAERARAEGSADPVTRAFQLLLGRAPVADELAACEDTELELVCRSLMNSNEFAFLP